MIISNWYRLYTQHIIIGNSLYKKHLSLILQGIPNRLTKIVFAISAEHVSRAGNIGSRIKLYVDVEVLMDDTDGLISPMTCDSFGS